MVKNDKTSQINNNEWFKWFDTFINNNEKVCQSFSRTMEWVSIILTNNEDTSADIINN